MRGRARPPFFRRMAVMIVALIGGLAAGVGATLAFILPNYKLKTNEECEAEEVERKALDMLVTKKMVENARLKVALASGAMTEEGKKVAAMTMAALETVIVS